MLAEPYDGVGLSDLQDAVECDVLDVRLSNFTTTGPATGLSISFPSPMEGVTTGRGLIICGLVILSNGRTTPRPRSTNSECVAREEDGDVAERREISSGARMGLFLSSGFVFFFVLSLFAGKIGAAAARVPCAEPTLPVRVSSRDRRPAGFAEGERPFS